MHALNIEFHKTVLVQQIHGRIAADCQFREQDHIGSMFLTRPPGKSQYFFPVAGKAADGGIDLGNGDFHDGSV